MQSLSYKYTILKILPNKQLTTAKILLYLYSSTYLVLVVQRIEQAPPKL